MYYIICFVIMGLFQDADRLDSVFFFFNYVRKHVNIFYYSNLLRL